MNDRAELIPLIDACRAKGARAAEVLRQRFDRLETTGCRVRPTRSSDERWTLRVWMEGGRAGVAVAPSRAGLADVALALAADAAPSPHAGPADRFAPIGGSLGLDDRRHATIEEADRNEFLLLAERSLNHGTVQLQQLRYQEVRESRSLMSTREVELAGAATTYTLEAVAGSGSLQLAHRIASRHFSDVASLPFGTELRRRIEGLLRPVALPVSGWPLVIDPRAAADFFRRLAPAFCADAVRAGNFLASRLGKPLSSSVLHITDDAGLSSGLFSRTFDDRGVPPIPVTLLKEGVPNSLYHDPESARALGLRPTGHVTDGALRPTNLVVRPGSRTRNVILAELSEHLVIDDLPPLNLATGRLVGPVLVGVVRGGQREGAAVAQLDLDVRDLLSCVHEVASDQERNGEVDAPTMVLRGLMLHA